MISVDTNVIVRLLTADEPAQHKKAKSLFARERIFIPLTVVLECEWVFRYAYKFGAEEIVDAFEFLFGLPNVEVQDQLAIRNALQWHKAGLDFADALHLAKSESAKAFATFDKKLIKTGRKLSGFRILEPK